MGSAQEQAMETRWDLCMTGSGTELCLLGGCQEDFRTISERLRRDESVPVEIARMYHLRLGLHSVTSWMESL